jgi:hypothetical protein
LRKKNNRDKGKPTTSLIPQPGRHSKSSGHNVGHYERSLECFARSVHCISLCKRCAKVEIEFISRSRTKRKGGAENQNSVDAPQRLSVQLAGWPGSSKGLSSQALTKTTGGYTQTSPVQKVVQSECSQTQPKRK